MTWPTLIAINVTACTTISINQFHNQLGLTLSLCCDINQFLQLVMLASFIIVYFVYDFYDNTTNNNNMVIKPFLLLSLAAEYRSRQWVWLNVVWWQSEVYDTHWLTKLTALETISRSRDMVGTHQNLNGSCDLIVPISEMVCHPWASTCNHRPTYLPNLKSLSPLNTKIWKAKQNVKMGWFGVVRITRSPDIAPINKGHMNSCYRSIATMSLSCTVSKI